MKTKQSFFGEQLKKIMSEKNLTQKDLADKLGFVHQRISFWATGRTVPTIASIKKVASALNVPVNYFIEQDDEKKQNDNNMDFNFIMNFVNEKTKRLELEVEVLKSKIKSLEEKINTNK